MLPNSAAELLQRRIESDLPQDRAPTAYELTFRATTTESRFEEYLADFHPWNQWHWNWPDVTELKRKTAAEARMYTCRSLNDKPSSAPR